MCGRFTSNINREELKKIYTATTEAFPGVNLSSGEIFPTNTVPILRGSDEGLTPVPAVWGYPKYQGKGVIINARAETAAEKFTFKDSLRNWRCVVPTTGYLEWFSDKTKYRFNLPDEPMLYLAGLFRQFDDGYRFVILTTEPNDSVKMVHNRMPVIVTADSIVRWAHDTSWSLSHLCSVMPGLIKNRYQTTEDGEDWQNCAGD